MIKFKKSVLLSVDSKSCVLKDKGLIDKCKIGGHNYSDILACARKESFCKDNFRI